MNDIPIIDTIKTGQNIKRLRIQRYIRISDLQRVFGFATPQAIYKWEQGRALPTIDNLLILARLFGVTMDEIIVCRGCKV